MQRLKEFATLCAGAHTPSVHGVRLCSQATTLVTHCAGVGGRFSAGDGAHELGTDTLTMGDADPAVPAHAALACNVEQVVVRGPVAQACGAKHVPIETVMTGTPQVGGSHPQAEHVAAGASSPPPASGATSPPSGATSPPSGARSPPSSTAVSAWGHGGGVGPS
jgi:hypothetical protein